MQFHYQPPLSGYMKWISLMSLWLLFHQKTFAQWYQNNDTRFVFVDEANVREKPSLDAKVLTKLKHGTEVMVCESSNKRDSINGKAGHWVSVLHNGYKGFVWDNTFANNGFTHNNGNKLLVKENSTGFTFKIFSGDSLLQTGSFLDKTNGEYAYCYLVLPLFAQRESLYVKWSESEKLYAFNGLQLLNAGSCDKDHVNSMHLAAQEKAPDTTTAYIIGNLVNLRESPQANAKVLGRLGKYTQVKMLKKLPDGEEINKEYNHWYQVMWQGKKGYVWGENIAAPLMHIYDNDDKNTTYLLTTYGLFVLVKGVMVANYIGQWELYNETIHSFGDMGFGKGYDFIAIETMANQCGQWGGDTYYLWDGKRLKYFRASGGVGDGGLSSGDEVIFPNEHIGIPGKIKVYSYAKEMIDIIPIDECERSYIHAIDYEYTAILNYNGDTLVEEPSINLDVKQLVQREFPKYDLAQYRLADFNKDGMDDVVLQVRKQTITKDANDHDVYGFTTKIAVALGKKEGLPEIIALNDKLLDKEDDYRINIQLQDSMLTITTYYTLEQGGYESDGEFGRKMYQFTYQPTNQQFNWHSISVIDKKGIHKLHFKKKKITFQQTWSFNPNEIEAVEE